MRALCLALSIVVAAGPAAAQQVRFTPEQALEVVSYSIQDISEDGAWVAALSSSRADLLGVDYRRDMDPTYLRPSPARLWAINTATGNATAVFPTSRTVRAAAWAPDARYLAALVVRTEGDDLVPVVWDRTTGRTRTLRLPADKYVAENSTLRWNRQGTRLVFAVRSRAWKTATQARFAEMTQGPVFVQSSKDPFLAWDELRRRGNQRAIVTYDIAGDRLDELVPEGMINEWHIADDDSTIVYAADITPKTDYDVIFGAESRVLARQGRTDRVVVPSTKGIRPLWSRDGLRYAYAKDGKLWVGSVADSTPKQIAGSQKPPAPGDTTKAARDSLAKERFTPIRVSSDGRELIASNSEGLWFIDAATGERSKFLATDDSIAQPRYTVVGWSEDRQTVQLAVSARRQWERGFARYDRRAGALAPAVRDTRLYSTPQFSRNGQTAVFTVSQGARPGDLYVAGADLSAPRRLVAANPGFDAIAVGKTELINYLDVDGQRQLGVVYYPPDYQSGKPYPTIFYVYESFFDERYESIIATLTASGYVVVQPSVSLETGFPGEGWLKGVTAAANHLIERGVADSSRLGLQGISYGGYATNLVVTQTKRFKAAINISGKVDIISFYTDSPRLGVRNIHAAEKSQDRIGATLWEQPQKYVAHSAVMYADRITTPLLLITGEQDSNVPAGNTREMYYALRRLGKPVTWVNYMNGGHGTPMNDRSDFLDFHRRIVAWYDEHLKGRVDGTAGR